MNNYFEPTLNSKSFNKHENDLIEAGCLDSKLLDDIKYESALPDDLLQSEANMNDFVNSFLTNMNDQIVYSNQLPDEIFETEEEISNGFPYDLIKLNKLTSQEEIVESKKVDEIEHPKNQPVLTFEPITNETTEIIEKDDLQPMPTINLINGSTIKIVNTTPLNQNVLTNPPIIIPTTTINTTITSTTINLPPIQQIQPIITPPTSISTVNSLSSSTNSSKTIESFDAMKFTGKIAVKKKEKPTKSLLEMEPEQLQNRRRKLWSTIVKKDIPKAYKTRVMNRKEVLNNCKKLASCCQKERKQKQSRSIGQFCYSRLAIPKLNKERSKKTNKEMETYKLNDQEPTNQLLVTVLPPQITDCNTTTPTTMNESNQDTKLNCLL